MPVTATVGYPIALPAVPPLWRGDPFDWRLSMTDADGTPVPLTGYGDSWLAEARTSASSKSAIAFTVDDSHAADGYLTLSLTGEQTAAMSYRTYLFDVQASGGERSPFTVWKGQITLDGDYSRA